MTLLLIHLWYHWLLPFPWYSRESHHLLL